MDKTKTASPVFFGCFHPTRFILAGNNGMYESSEEFEIRRDPTIDYGVSCPWAYEKITICLGLKSRCVSANRPEKNRVGRSDFFFLQIFIK